MTDLPVGPDLDRAVEAALSNIQIGDVDEHAFAWSCDTTLQSQLLDWFRRLGVNVTIHCWPEGFCVTAQIITGANEDVIVSRMGATINEALCRLVLAVAAAKAGT